jgi:DNA-directed RNA polymerase beta subunit
MQKPMKEPKAPEGVELRDPMDFVTLRTQIYNDTMDAVKRSFPQSYGGVRMEVDNLEYDGPEEYDLAEQKKALMTDKYLARRLRGTVRLTDEKTGQLLDEKKTTLLRAPFLTDRGTFVHNGSEYVTLTQSRLIPGVYTRRKKNGQIETQFNVRPGSGNTFRVGFEPDTAQYKLDIHNSNLHMYSLLHDLGIPDEQLAQSWGSEILEANKQRYDKRVFDKAYAKLVPRFLKEEDADHARKTELIKLSLERAKIHEKVARRNLPNLFDQVKSAEWRTKWEAKKIAIEMAENELAQIEFAPDLPPDELIKSAAEFNPDLTVDEMQDSYDQLFNPDKPRLASLEHWPQEWIPEGSNPKGWVAWYIDYQNGKRTPDDERQIKRWKSFRARHGEQFKKNPTPRRGYALRNWAIDPLKLIEDPELRKEAERKMEEYKYKQELKYNAIKMGSASSGMLMLARIMAEDTDFNYSDTDEPVEIFEKLVEYCDAE